MARLIGSLNEGSLLRRTVLHVGTFVLGSLAFVALLSVLLVSVAKSILPAPAGEGAADKGAASDKGAAADKAGAADDDEADDGTPGGKPPPSKPRKRIRPVPALNKDTERADD